MCRCQNIRKQMHCMCWHVDEVYKYAKLQLQLQQRSVCGEKDSMNCTDPRYQYSVDHAIMQLTHPSPSNVSYIKHFVLSINTYCSSQSCPWTAQANWSPGICSGDSVTPAASKMAVFFLSPYQMSYPLILREGAALNFDWFLSWNSQPRLDVLLTMQIPTLYARRR